MLTVLKLTTNQTAEWDAIVRSFPEYDSYYLSGYFQATATDNDEPTLFYYEAPSFTALHVAIRQDLSDQPLFKNKLASRTYYQLNSGSGYGGFLFTGKPSLTQLAELERVYQAYCDTHQIISETVRFHPTHQAQTLNQYMYHSELLAKGVTLSLHQGAWLRTLQPGLTTQIQMALKAGVELAVGDDGLALEQLYQFTKMVPTNGPLNCQRAYLGRLRQQFPGHYQVFSATYQGQVLAAGLVLEHNHHLNAQFFGHLPHALGVTAENLLYYAAAEWGQEIGATSFFLGGGSAQQLNHQTVLNFSGQPLTRLSIGQRVFNQQHFQQLLTDTKTNYLALQASWPLAATG